MKQLFLIIGILLLVACNGGNQKGVKFAPKERASNLTEQERKEAISKKRAELSGLNIDTLLLSNNIKLTVLSPKPKDEITLQVSELAETKMIQIACQNGISGLGTTPVFVLAMTMTPSSKGITSTIPEKKTGTYTINVYVGNVMTKDIYASMSSQIMGVGDTFEQAAISAVSSIENTSDFQDMLKKASARIIQWYDTNVETFKMQVEKYVALGEYAQAHALLSSVPESATRCFGYVQIKQGSVLKSLLEQRKADNLAGMKNAIAEAGTSYSAKVAGYYQMIPADCPERKIADKLYEKYMLDMESAVNSEIEHKRYMDKSEVEFRVLQVQAEIEASHATMSQYQSISTASHVQESESSSNEEGGVFDMILGNVVNLAMSHVPTLLSMLI
ncbi:MAG: hypothetical protein V8Q70_08700 [Bacteroides eggerthii]